MLESILIVATLAINLLLTVAIGFMWKLLNATTVLSLHTALYLQERDPDFMEDLETEKPPPN